MIIICPKCDKSIMPMLERLKVEIREIDKFWRFIHDPPCRGMSLVKNITGKEITLELA